MENLNKSLDLKSNHEQETQTHDQQTDLSLSLDSNDDHESQQKLIVIIIS
jgi:hypothetical protein